MDDEEEEMSTANATINRPPRRKPGGSGRRDRPRKELPLCPSSREIGDGLRTAIIEAGYVNEETGEADLKRAAAAIQRTLPSGQTFSGNDLCHLCQGYRNPQADRIMAIIAILGLRVQTVFPHLYDQSGRQYTPRNHPWMYPEGYRIDAV
jgi:hypothetical protein